MKLRAAAAKIMLAVLSGHSLADVLPMALTAFPKKNDQALLQALCYGVCRHYYRLAYWLQLLLPKPLKAKDRDIYCLLLVGLYQLNEMRIPSHAAVAETVAAAKEVKKIWAKGLINAVLREFLRQQSELQAVPLAETSAYYLHPEWIITQLKTDWPEDWQAILLANNQHPPFALRVNQQHLSREHYLARLSTALNAQAIAGTTAGIILEHPMNAEELPGFAAGDISVQDGAAQLAPTLLDLQPGMRVLDVCAAPGGKATHILETQPSVQLVALDKAPERLQKVTANLTRLRLSATCLAADAGALADWWDGKLFNRILLDAPCSASGVIRRHPDIKLLRRAEDIAKLAQEQKRLLDAAWKTLAPGGLLVYATCSLFAAENVDIIRAFLMEQPDAAEEPISAAWGKTCVYGRQILPGMDQMDGFYYARVRKALT